MRKVILAAAMLGATAAAAQNAPTTANPPGNTLAPQVTMAPAPAAVAVAAVPPGTPPLTPAQIAAAKYRTEVVCKTSIETGSLIARHKTCLTRSQWQYVNDQNERAARRLVTQGDTQIGGN